MAFTTITTAEIAEDAAIKASTATKIKDSLDFLEEERKNMEALYWATIFM